MSEGAPRRFGVAIALAFACFATGGCIGGCSAGEPSTDTAAIEAKPLSDQEGAVCGNGSCPSQHRSRLLLIKGDCNSPEGRSVTYT